MISHSFFNDVLGPIMAGCARIGRMTRLLCGKEISKAVVVYDSQGSYPSTCVGQGAKLGFTGGLLGFDPVILLDETILSMYEVGQILPS